MSDQEHDEFKEQDQQPRKRAPRKPSGKKGETIAVEECTQRVHQAYGLTGKLFRSSKSRNEKDFKEEGAMLSRLSEKHSVIATILKWLDPIFFVVGIWNKFSEHGEEMRERKAQAKRDKANRQAGQMAVIMDDPNSEPTAYPPS